ncbi:hypothetical protein P0Y35_02000 [Kiritimatiellaeota bacterium B1221]|nr:hypothetical protein [Kiritimatiellaeota bacterium B1221]
MKPFLLSLLLFLPLFAQEDLPVPNPAAPVSAAEASTAVEPAPTEAPPTFTNLDDELASLSALNDSITLREEKRDHLYAQRNAAIDPIQKDKLVPELEKINKEIAELNFRLQSIAVRTDVSIFEDAPKKEFNWQDELGQLLEPLLAEINAATKDSRELGKLTSQLELNQERLKAAEQALKSLEPLLAESTDPELTSRLTQLQEKWKGLYDDAQNQITFAELQLKQREENKQPAIEEAKAAASGFLRSSGLNLVLGILAFIIVYLAMGWIARAWNKFRPSRKKGRSFSNRLSSLLWTLLTLILALGGLIGTFNARGDILLLSVSLLFLLGIGWGAMKTLPGMIELFRMMLNMGAVREDERLVYEGLPWKVNSISFRTELVNPLLNGGVLTLPTRMLVGLLSRPKGEDEEWFPSRKEDWVLLADGTFGKVSYQTPSSVQIIPPGGSQRVYTTLQYMELSPTVLSTGFRREVSFGIDYRHIADATSLIPNAMEKHLHQELEGRLGENLQHLQVQLAEASDSALKLCIIVDCKGEVADQWPYLPMWIQMALVDLCNQKGWSIPFPQLQVHTHN